MKKTKKYTAVGALIDVAVPTLYLIVITVEMALSYKGTCGDLMPFSAQWDCTLPEYLHRMVGFIVSIDLIILRENWLITLAVLLLPPGVGYLLGRWRSAKA